MELAKLPEDFLSFCDFIGFELYPWQREAFGVAVRREQGRFVTPLAAVSVPRGNGKSWGAAAVGLWRLFCGQPNSPIIVCALDAKGAGVILQAAKSILRMCPDLEELATVQNDVISILSTGSSITVTSREHTASRGTHPVVCLYDEVGWARDGELFASLLAAQAPCIDPLFLIVSTVGRKRSGPLWDVKTLAEKETPGVLWWWTGENLSPRVTQKYLTRQRNILMPMVFAREHENSWVDSADSLTNSDDVDAAMATGWQQQFTPRPQNVYVAFVDLGVVNDPAVIGIGHLEGENVHIDRLITFQGERNRQVQFEAVEATIRDLIDTFGIVKFRLEDWQAVQMTQNLIKTYGDAEKGGVIEMIRQTEKRHSLEWPILAQRLATRTLILPEHQRLREQLLNLTYELVQTGIRVISRAAIHQDHALVARSICSMLSGGTMNMTIATPWAGGYRDMAVAVVREAPMSDPEAGESMVWGSGTTASGIDWNKANW